MSLDHLNVGILKTYEEILVAVFFCFPLSTMNVTQFSVCKFTLGVSCQQIEWKYKSLHFTFLTQN